MFSEWNKFCGWRVLQFFLSNPNTYIHIKGLAKKLKISPATSERYLKLYKTEDILKEEKIANTKQFYLNNDYTLVKKLKQTWFLLKLQENNFVQKFITRNPSVNTLALYGAYASGEFSEESDVDFLIISQGTANLKELLALEKKFGKKIEVTQMSVGKWRNLLNKNDAFVKSVSKNNVILYGAKI